MRADRNAPGVVLMGGLANTVSLCRSFGREGIDVTVCASRRCPAHFSRFCRNSIVPEHGERFAEFWYRVLVENPDPALKGKVLFTCNDEAIEFVAKHEAALAGTFLLEANPSSARLALLNKRESMLIAEKAGLHVPRFVDVSTLDDVEAALTKTQMPILVRPHVSHEFTEVFGWKVILCSSASEVSDACGTAFEAGVAVTLCEYIPGPDDKLCSYYTYIDESGSALCAFTKRVIRRHPYNFGEGSYHVTKWLPEVAAVGQKFFDEAKLRGIGNIEFKLDERNGRLVFIECNARFTATQEILVQSNFDIGLFAYGQLTGIPYALPETFSEGIKMSISFRDLRAYRHLWKQGKASIMSWIPDTARAKARPYFKWSDPGPLLARAAKRFL